MVAAVERGILGGTFNPVHLGHLLVGEETRMQLGLGEILFVPAGEPWMKDGDDLAGQEDRWEMVRLATASNPHFTPCRVDLDRGGPTYAIDTLKELRRHDAGPCAYYFIMGMDALLDMHRWKEPKLLLEMCRIAAVTRPDTDKVAAVAAVASHLPEAAGRIVFVDGLNVDISSTDIRRRRREGRSIKYRVPEPVEACILERELYR